MHFTVILLLAITVIVLGFRHYREEDLYFSKSSKGPRIGRHSYFKQTFRLGYKLKLFCEAEGDPRPDVHWYKDGIELKLVKGKVIRSITKLLSTATFLNIDPAKMSDAGQYGCVAHNINGYHVKYMKVEYNL
uniref:Ig-like domain-containing protein n=1 Tax=Heterorhabditis bacteriophora TaxID=37862 RepID=A0A1I7WZF8_HETBA